MNVVAPTKRRAPSVRIGRDVGASVDEAAAHLDRLVGGDATGDPEDDPAAGEHGPGRAPASQRSGVVDRAVTRPTRPRPASSSTSGGSTGTILSAAISSKAIDRGLRATEVTCGGTMAPRPSPSCPK